MSTNSKRRRLIHRLRNKAYRDAYVAQHSTIGLPFQIRAMRDARRWTQRELGQRAGMKQESISLLENPGYGKFTLRTLNRLAAAFDVGLLVRFVPFSRLIQEMMDVEPEQLAVPSFEADPGLAEGTAPSSSLSVTIAADGIELPSVMTSWLPIRSEQPSTDQGVTWTLPHAVSPGNLYEGGSTNGSMFAARGVVH